MAMSNTEKCKRYRLRHKALGLCTKCPVLAEPGKLVCARHARQSIENYRKWSEENQEHFALYRKSPEYRARNAARMRAIRTPKTEAA
jgi:hypothetical protein